MAIRRTDDNTPAKRQRPELDDTVLTVDGKGKTRVGTVMDKSDSGENNRYWLVATDDEDVILVDSPKKIEVLFRPGGERSRS
jgi:hypothetical protein